MMFTAPRFVVVDDRKAHLDAILSSFQRIGSPCIGILFNPEDEIDRNHFRGLRCLFLDLHLVGGQIGTDHRGDFARIQTILEDNISENGGPFVLVMWTAHPHLKDQLTEYLEKNIDPVLPHARPLAIFSLPKEDFIPDLDSGDVKEPEKLRDALQTAILSNPQLAALLGWESDVLSAAGDTLASLLKLVPAGQRTSTTFPNALDTILSRLAREAVGCPNVEINLRTAITTALAPILADRVINQQVTPETMELWTRAVTRYKDTALKDASREEAGYVNRMLHVAIPGAETIRPTDWGAVVDLEGTIWNSEDQMSNIFDGTRNELLRDEFKIKEEDYGKCRPCLVRVGAACDYAQKRRGPLTYLLGLEIPADLKRDRGGTAPQAEWKSPVMMLDGDGGPFCLHVNVRFSISKSASDCNDWTVRYRIREQLLMQLLSHSNGYTARPGIVQLPAK